MNNSRQLKEIEHKIGGMKIKITSNLIPKVTPGVFFKSERDGTVMLIKADDYSYFYSIDGIAASVWLSFDGQSTLASIYKKIAKQFDAPSARIEKDTNKFIQSLLSEKLVLLK